jgi:uncharacterized protein (TIGR00661 family)
MRVLYGVVGEGMGHAIRSKVVLEHLLAEGHHVEVMTSGRAAEFLRSSFDLVHEIHGFHMIGEENRIRRGKTLWSNVLEGRKTVPANIAAYFDLIRRFEPQVVVSDFESWTYLYARAHGLPVISIDNIQIINRARHSDAVLDGQKANFRVAKAFVRAKLPFADHYVIATFFRPDSLKDRTTLVPPILRREILDTRATDGEHLLVYQTMEDHDALVAALRACGRQCRVYGLRRNLEHEVVEDNLVYRPFSEQGFIDDLSSAHAVVAAGGFTLMGEAVFLRKPMLAVPLENQFEQVLNARYLVREGYGATEPAITDADQIQAFLETVPACRAALARVEHDRNTKLFEVVDELLDQAAAGVFN